MTDSLIKKILIILVAIALALGVISFIVVFFPGELGGSVAENNVTSSDLPTTTNTTSTGLNQGSDSSTSPGMIPTSNTSIGGNGNASSGFESEFSAPYAVNWTDGNEQFSITGASLYENQLTITLSVKTGNASECVPLNLHLIKDENGDVQSPDSPQFTFPDSGSCTGAPNETYSEPVTFTIADGTPSPYLLNTGGSANTFFTAATTTDGGVNISLPATAG